MLYFNNSQTKKKKLPKKYPKKDKNRKSNQFKTVLNSINNISLIIKLKQIVC